MKTITIDKVEYRLVPVENQQTASSEPKEALMKDYGVEETGVKKAVPEVSEYRERFKQRKLTLADINKNKPNLRPLTQADGELDKFSHQGDKLFFGTGISYDI